MITNDLRFLLAEKLKDAELNKIVRGMVGHIVDKANADLSDTKNKVTRPDLLSDETLKIIIKEQGFSYIADVMDTVTGVEFDTLVLFLDLIVQLKGTRIGMELVLKLLGFDSIIKEWWQNEKPQEPWSHEIIVIMNTSNVPNIYDTLDKIKIFSEYYSISLISNIDVRFSASRFAEAAPIMGGFSKVVHTGRFIQKARP